MTIHHLNFAMARRDFFGRFALGLGGMALARAMGRRCARCLHRAGGWIDSSAWSADTQRHENDY